MVTGVASQIPIFQSSPVREEYPSFHFIKYMGSKREIVDWVGRTIDKLVPTNSCILDLMAGTSAVGYALSSRHRIIANDIQHYSRVLACTLLNTMSAIPPGDSIWQLLNQAYQQNRKVLRRFLAPHLETESGFVGETLVNKHLVNRYETFQRQYPHAGDLKHEEIFNGLGSRFEKLLKIRRSDRASIPYCLFTMYFANSYFSIEQAIDIDSLRYAIDVVFPEGSELGPLALSCLMHAASYCTPGPGHFAQFRALNSIAVCEDILRYRNRSISEYFLKKWAEFRSNHRIPFRADNLANSEDFRAAIEAHVADCDLVYVDPPYSFVHYSRFYHALETLIRYDYPGSEFYGRYRSDRHQSPFCIRNQVADAFQSIISKVANAKKKLVFSYSNTGMISLEELRTLSQARFSTVKVITNDYLHATMGRRGDKHREVEEALILCEP